jgi:hypothetical protein
MRRYSFHYFDAQGHGRPHNDADRNATWFEAKREGHAVADVKPANYLISASPALKKDRLRSWGSQFEITA